VARIVLDDVTKVFAGGVIAVDGIDLIVDDGEFMVLVGPSGCGKSTLLRMIAGLETVDRGRILVDGSDVTGVEPQDRDIAMVFQSYALYPHMSVRDNLGFGLRMRGVPRGQIRARVDEVARTLGLDDLLERRPGALSGGQRQRVAMGRAIAREPRAFLMDEPLSNLDAGLRVTMRGELARLHARLGTTTVYVTHDQTEAMTLGSRVAVLRGGVLQQCATPTELFRAPTNLFVARFIGSPPMNLADATISGGNVELADARVPLPPGTSVADGTHVVAGVRPTDLRIADASSPSGLAATIEVVEELGSEKLVIFPVDATVPAEASIGGDQHLLRDGTSRFTARIDGDADVQPGARLAFEIDPRRLYLFDATTGQALSQQSSTEPSGAPT
jgi:multiple sugar transport system ATP-binding protein